MGFFETESFIDPLTGMEFALIPAGEFIMGNNDGNYDEKPEHKVLISKSFHIGKFPVVQSQWERIMGHNPSKFKGKNNPVENVSWYDCIKYITKLNEIASRRYRLPTEAEWEYACRAGSTTKFFFGNDQNVLEKYAWFFDKNKLEDSQKTHPVGLKQPNAWGLYDMIGNVNEWCWDEFTHEAYSNHQFENPLNFNDGLISILDDDGLPCRALRGGCFNNPSQFLGSYKRKYSGPNTRYYNIGFRLVRTVSGLEDLWELEYLPEHENGWNDEADISAKDRSMQEEVQVNEGYIYILINPSLQKNLLKIGKTSRDPETRAVEISGGTGVPSPYHVAYSVKVPDHHFAERIIHQKLKEYRVRNEREFFLLPLQKAIDTLTKIAEHMAK